MVDKTSDVFAVAATLFHAATGQAPALDPVRPTEIAASVPMCGWLRRAMAFSRYERFADAASALEALRHPLLPAPSQPESMTVGLDAGGALLEISRFRWQHAFSLMFSLPFMLVGGSFVWGGQFWAVAHLAIGATIFATSLRSLINLVKVRVANGIISVKEGPLSLARVRHWRVDQILGFEVVVETHRGGKGGPTYSYDVHARLADGHRTTMVSGLTHNFEAQFVVDFLDRRR